MHKEVKEKASGADQVKKNQIERKLKTQIDIEDMKGRQYYIGGDSINIKPRGNKFDSITMKETQCIGTSTDDKYDNEDFFL